jgi:hypothetical protein
MKKNIFLSRNRRCINISTKKRGRKSKMGKRGKNSKWNKRSKRVKIVNTNMRKNRTKKGRRNVQKGGTVYKLTQGNKKGGVETIYYYVGKDNQLKFNNPSIPQDPLRTWRKHIYKGTGTDGNDKICYVNDGKHEINGKMVLCTPDGILYDSDVQEQTNLPSLLFKKEIIHPEHQISFLDTLRLFITTNPDINLSSYNFQSIDKNQTILYAACRTPYVSLYILNLLTTTFNCSPDVQTSDGFYPLGALMSSLRDNIKSGIYFPQELVSKYITAIKILFDFYASQISYNNRLIKLKKNKNKDGFTAYDDFGLLHLYEYIYDCNQLNEICKLLLVNSGDSFWKNATVLFQVCSEEKIYPGLIQRLIECGGDVNHKSIVREHDNYDLSSTDVKKSGYPITALIKSYERIKSADGDVTNCKAAIQNVSKLTDMKLLEVDYYHKDTPKKIEEILST